LVGHGLAGNKRRFGEMLLGGLFRIGQECKVVRSNTETKKEKKRN